MNKTCFRLSLVLIVLNGISSVVSAQPTCDRTYVGSNGGAWDTNGNWNPNGAPSPTLVACIPPGKQVVVSASGAAAKAIYIQADSTSGPGKITVNYDKTLTIYESSYIEGELQLNFPAGELIGNSGLTITGDGGKIHGGAHPNLWELVNPPGHQHDQRNADH
jgi:hypothetical protein